MAAPCSVCSPIVEKAACRLQNQEFIIVTVTVCFHTPLSPCIFHPTVTPASPLWKTLPCISNWPTICPAPSTAAPCPPGSRLPSVRKTAHSRQLSLNTVVAAYRVLEDRGLVEARPQSGYYVKARLASPARGALREAGPAQGTDGAVLDLIGAALQAQQTPGYIDMALACPRGGDFYPAGKLARLMGQVLRKNPGLVSNYALPPGSERLRTQIARRGLELGMALQADNIILTHGAMEALQLALRAVCRHGDTVGIESPHLFQPAATVCQPWAQSGRDPDRPATRPVAGCAGNAAGRKTAAGGGGDAQCAQPAGLQHVHR